MGPGSELPTWGGSAWPTDAWLGTTDGVVTVPPISPGFVCKRCRNRPCICDYIEPEIDTAEHGAWKSQGGLESVYSRQELSSLDHGLHDGIGQLPQHSGLDGPLPPYSTESGDWVWPRGAPEYHEPTDGPQVPFNDETELPMGWDPTADTEGVFTEVFEAARQVYRHGMCSLPGSTIKYEAFVQIGRYAVHRGFVEPAVADRVLHWLRWGTDVGAQRSLLRGVRVFENYPTALGEFSGRVAKALTKRVSAHKTLDLGDWHDGLRVVARAVFQDFFVAPMLAVPKPLEPGECRPATAHDVTTFNDAIDMTGLTHELRGYEEIAAFLKTGYVMAVTDVADAFPLLGLATWTWPFFALRFRRGAQQPDGSWDVFGMTRLLMHLFADFGTRGMPGVFKLLYKDMLLGMARSVNVLTMPMVVWVDDCGLIGAARRRCDTEMWAFQKFAGLLGILFKWLKDKAAAQVIPMIGFWWDSFSRTISLLEDKLGSYMQMFLAFSVRSSLSLRERRCGAGRAQRAVMTLPPGARCLLQPIYAAMHGLKHAWQQRKTNKLERTAWLFLYEVLALNMGRGYFSYDGFTPGPAVCTDASKSGRYAGGGAVENDGDADWWVYGASASKRLIDWLEADTVLEYTRTSCHKWYKRIVDFWIDNSAFELSGEAGRSRVERLNVVLQKLFLLQVEHTFIIRFNWIPTDDNTMADHLSRGRIEAFYLAVAAEAMIVGFFVGGFFWAGKAVRIRMAAEAGRTLGTDLSVRQWVPRSDGLLALARPIVDMAKYSMQVRSAVIIQAAARGMFARYKQAVRKINAVG